ncbi:hypothetical protein M8818_003902 [Zalaria obscura]|uniref:Uncharacterized protein n=1 Tax=Zalaria obscura TaxID=2024903 RepID=A0ACC3SD07_9PEZI
MKRIGRSVCEESKLKSRTIYLKTRPNGEYFRPEAGTITGRDRSGDASEDTWEKNGDTHGAMAGRTPSEYIPMLPHIVDTMDQTSAVVPKAGVAEQLGSSRPRMPDKVTSRQNLPFSAQ